MTHITVFTPCLLEIIDKTASLWEIISHANNFIGILVWRLDRLAIYNAPLCFVGPIDNGSLVGNVEQLVPKYEADETIGTTKSGTRGVFLLFRSSVFLASRATYFADSLLVFLFCFSTCFLAFFWFVDSFDFKALANILSTSIFASFVLSIGPYSQWNYWINHKSMRLVHRNNPISWKTLNPIHQNANFMLLN